MLETHPAVYVPFTGLPVLQRGCRCAAEVMTPMTPMTPPMGYRTPPPMMPVMPVMTPPVPMMLAPMPRISALAARVCLSGRGFKLPSVEFGVIGNRMALATYFKIIEVFLAFFKRAVDSGCNPEMLLKCLIFQCLSPNFYSQTWMTGQFTGNPDQFDGKKPLGFRLRFSLKPIH